MSYLLLLATADHPLPDIPLECHTIKDTTLSVSSIGPSSDEAGHSLNSYVFHVLVVVAAVSSRHIVSGPEQEEAGLVRCVGDMGVVTLVIERCPDIVFFLNRQEDE